jgi:hypothetical protein|tara:strand:- start:2800 stop:2979 length:180 start_codon:yes stop_codon:yes gene_type:complete
MKNLWQLDRKTIFKELTKVYQQAGYSKKESKRLASEEAKEMEEYDMSFVSDLLDGEESE